MAGCAAALAGGPQPLFEIVFVDGYSMEGKLVEIEVTAERKA